MFLRFSKNNIIIIVLCISFTLLQVIVSADKINELKKRVRSSMSIYPQAKENEDNPYQNIQLEPNEVVLYTTPASPPCRALMMLEEFLNITFVEKYVDLFRRQHYTEWFKKINPFHTLPAIEIKIGDNNENLQESHALLKYFVEQHPKNDESKKLYPTDSKEKQAVDALLIFDDELYGDFRLQYNPWIWFGAEKPQKEKDKVIPKLKIFNDHILASSKFAVGDNFSIADIALLASVSTFEAAGINIDVYPNIKQWLTNCKKNITDYDTKQKPIMDVIREKIAIRFADDIVKAATKAQIAADTAAATVKEAATGADEPYKKEFDAAAAVVDAAAKAAAAAATAAAAAKDAVAVIVAAAKNADEAAAD